MKMNKTLVGILIGVVATSIVFLALYSFVVKGPVEIQETDAASFRLPATFLKSLSTKGVTVFVGGKMVQPSMSVNPDGSAVFNYSGNGVTLNGSYSFTK